MGRRISSVHSLAYIIIAIVSLALIVLVCPTRSQVSAKIERDTPKPAKITIISGNNQSGGGGTILTNPFVVEVRAHGNYLLPLADVKFTVLQGGGALTPNPAIDSIAQPSITVKTDYRGRAEAWLYLGKLKGINTVEARVADVDPVFFTAITVNSPPVLNPIGNKQVNEAAVLTFTVSATDPDPGDTVTLSASNLPANASFNTATGVFVFIPNYFQSGVHKVTFRASDGTLTDSETISITVININRPPVLTPIGHRTVDENTEIVITISATDPDGDPVTFSAEDMPAGAVLETQPNATRCKFRWKPGYNTVTSGDFLNFHVKFTVKDSWNATDSELVTITVRNVEPPPDPDIRVVPPVMDFGTVEVGEWSDQLLQIHNDGGVALVIDLIASTDPQFTILSYSQINSLFVDVKPVEAIPVSVSAVYPTLDAKLMYKGLPVLNPGEMILVKTRFKPTSAGTKEAEFIIASNDPDEPFVPVPVSGEATQTPDIRVIPTSIDFGEVALGAFAEETLRIHNDGNGVLQIISITSTDPQFTISGHSDVDPHSYIDVVVKFTPSFLGEKTGTLNIESNDPDEPLVPVDLRGESVNPPVPDILVSPPSIIFNDVIVGEWQDKEFRIYNDGNAPLEVSEITSDSTHFVVRADPNDPVVTPGGVVTIPVRFKPTVAGVATGTITILSSDPDESSVSVPVQGEGVDPPIPDIRISPTMMDYGNVYVGEWQDKEFRIYNDGNATLEVSKIKSNSSKYIVLADPNDPSVPPGGVVTIPVRFKPLAQGTWVAYITITSNDPDKPVRSVFARGTATEPPVPDIHIVPASVNFGDVELGSYSDETFQIRNVGGDVLQIHSITSNNPTHFEVTGHTDIDPGEAVNVTVRFTPSELGTETGEITITTNDLDELTVYVPLTGNGAQPIAPDIYVAPLVMNLGDVEVGESVESSFFIYNFGTITLEIHSISSDNFEFTVLNEPNVAPGTSEEIGVRFTPFTFGERSADITVASNDLDEPYITVSVYGEGLNPGYPITGNWQLIRQSNLLVHLRDVHFISDYDGWVVGTSGTIANSDDGGITWDLQPRITSRALRGVHFTSANTGWAVGQYGTMMRTTNGGFSWLSYNSGVYNDLNAIQFVGSTRGWVVGAAGTILATTNGSTWTDQDSGTNLSLQDLCFVSSYRGWAVGNYGVILYTSNGGQTWTTQTSGTTITLNGVDFVGYYDGWAVGNAGKILHTQNGGQTWTPQTNGVPYITFKDVDFISASEGWAVGYDGTVIYTSNGGSTWTQVDSGVSENLWSVQFLDDEAGWAVGSNGTILKYYQEVPPIITSVNVSGSPARTGDVITVVATGQPGNNARFSISGVIQNRLMTENPAGVYIGTYTATAGVNVTDAPVTVTLTNWQGETATDTSHTVTIDTTAAINWASVTPDKVKTGDTATITMMAETGGTAIFSIENVTTSIVMIESSSTPGKYIGHYTVSPGTNADNAKVMVHLTDASGNVNQAEAGYITIDTVAYVTSVSISGSPAKLGDPIIVTLVGEAGGSCEFSISGVVSGVDMSEAPAGVYTGSYVAPAGTNVTSATLTAKLTDAIGNPASRYGGRVAIDTESRIDTVSVSGSPAKTGESISVVMTGESGGSAQFSIAGVVNNVPMTEAAYPQGKYTGEYIVADGDDVIEAVLTVVLTDAVGNVGANADNRVNIDTIAPEITSVDVSGSPAKAGEIIGVVMTGEPSGSAKFSIAGVINNVAMTEDAAQSGTYTGTYTVVAGGDVIDAVLTASLEDAVGNVSTDTSQSVDIDTTVPVITSVVVSGSPAGVGGSIDVTMVGEPGGSAKFSIAGVVIDFAMVEDAAQPGTYTGTYVIAGGVVDTINVTDAVVTVTLADTVGNESADASESVTIDTTIPEITSVDVTGSPARAGETITVVMVGEPGESAQFSIAGVAESIAMDESADQPGTYTGTYTAVDGTNVADAVVTVTLADAVGNESADASQSVTIDTTVPEIISVDVIGSPANLGDTITITLVGEPGGAAQFFIADVINNVPMTESADQPGTYTGTYTVTEDINVTDAVVTVTLTDAAGNVSADSTRTVTIEATIPEIASVDVTGSPAKIGEEIGVTMTGDPGASAQFSIAGIVENVTMEESAEQPGTYTGSYTVAEGDMYVADAVVTATLEDADGNIGTDANARVAIYPSWDVDRDGTIGIPDLVMVAAYFGQENPEYGDADVNGDGLVDILDLIVVCQHFDESINSASPGREMAKAQPGQVPILRELYESIRGIRGDAELIAAKELLAQLVGLTHFEVTKSRLMQSYPNPCNPETWIPYDLADPGNVTISIYSLSGKLVRTLDLGYKDMGRYADKARAAYWDGVNESGEKVSSGIYFYAIKSGEFSAVRKMLVTR